MLFVSSTYTDLVAERQAVRQVLVARGVDAVGGMECYFSEPRESLDVCLQWVAQAHALVVIVGFRAGSLIPESSSLTYTAAEVDAAISRGIPIFAFIKKRDGLWRNDEADEALRAALDGFKTRVEELAKTPAYFSTPEDLAIKVLQTIRAWEQLGRPGGRQVFASPSEFFTIDSPSSKYFQHCSPLRGRTEHMQALNAFLESPAHVCALLQARGGQGKTKLLHDWTAPLADTWSVLFVRPRAVWHSEASREVPVAERVLFIIDDAHRETDLFDRVLLLTNRFRSAPNRRLKVVAAHRPSGQTALTATAAKRVGSEALYHLPALKQLSQVDLRAIAEDILPGDLHRHSRRLVTVAGDSPLVVSVGARMLAAGELPVDLTDDHRFKQEVLDRFYFDYTEHPAVANRRPLLELLAAIGPVGIQSEWFSDLASSFLGIQKHEVLQGCALLESHGLVIRTRNGLRVTPDVLSDHLFRNASVNSRGESTGYVQALFDAFGRTPVFSNLLTNASELAWGLRQGGSRFNPTAPIWDGLRQAIIEAGEYGRRPILQAVRNAAFYEPSNALDVIAPILDISLQDDDVIQILAATAYHPEFTERAVEHLWSMALRDTRPENSYPSHAGRVLRELAEFGMHKHVELNDRILSIAIRRGADPTAYQARFTPLDIVDAVLKKHIEHRESDEDALYLSTHGLNYDVVGSVRRRALPAIRTALWIDSPEAQARAVQSIRSVLQADLGGLGRVPNDAEHGWQDTERLDVIAMIEERATARQTPVPLLYCLTRALLDFNAPQDDPVLRRVRAVLKRVRRPRELPIFSALCSASWDDWKTPEIFKKRVAKASALLAKSCPDVEARVERLHQLTDAAQRYGVFQDTGAAAVCEELCVERPFLEALVKRVFAGDGVLTRFLSVAMRELRRTDLTACRRLMARALQSADTNIRGAAVHGIAFGSQAGSEIDIDMLAEAAHDESSWVRRLVVDGLRVIAHHHPAHAAAAVGRLTLVSPRSDKDSADWWCGALAVHAGTLSPDQVNKVLQELIGIDRLDDYHVGELLQNLTRTHPKELASFLVSRLDEYSRRVERDEYGYRPVPDFMRHSLEAIAPHARELLAAFRDAVPTAPPHLKQELIDMFWAIGGRSDEALALVDEWLHSTECSVARTALSLLNAAPHRLCLERPTFAGHVLQVCAGTALLDRAEKAIVANCRPNGWSRKKGGAPEEHTKVVADARELARKWSGTFVADAMVRIADEIERESRAIAAEDDP